MKVEYNNLYTHFVLTTLHREMLIPETGRVRLEKYITGILHHNNCRLYSIYANPDHVHILVSRSPDMDEERLATIIAESTDRFINENKLSSGRFRWQESCAAFSVSKRDVGKVCKYILNQPEHHKKQSSKEEYDASVHFYQKTLNPASKENAEPTMKNISKDK
jgi:REP element-mobilizing transposase RayT